MTLIKYIRHFGLIKKSISLILFLAHIAPLAADATAFVLTATGMPVQVCGAVARVFNNQTDPDLAAPACAGTPATLTLQLRN